MKTFTIVSSSEQKKYVIETEASTMAELTAAMDAASINYSGMTLYEGLTKAEYDPSKGDAILPHDVPYKGTTTNDLVFMLTVPQKKIKSGATYAEMKAYIKDNGLADNFSAKYGKNYTQGKTAEFEEFISSLTKTAKEKAPVVEDTSVVEDAPMLNAFVKLLEVLYDYDYIYSDDRRDILDILNKKSVSSAKTVGKKSPFSDNEIDDMFADI